MLRQTVYVGVFGHVHVCVFVWEENDTDTGAIVKQWRKGSLSQWGQTLVDLICDFTHKDHSEQSPSHPSAPHTYINSPQSPRESPGRPKVLQDTCCRVLWSSCQNIQTQTARLPAPHRCRHLTYGYHHKTHHLHLAYSHHKKEQQFELWFSFKAPCLPFLFIGLHNLAKYFLLIYQIWL